MIVLFAMLAGMAPGGLSCRVSRDRIDIVIPASPAPSIRSVAVVHAGEWRTIVDDRHHLAAFRPGDRMLTLPRATQQAIVWRGGREHPVAAFPGPGDYRIVLADSLETEPENMTTLSCRNRLR